MKMRKVRKKRTNLKYNDSNDFEEEKTDCLFSLFILASAKAAETSPKINIYIP